MDVLPVRETHAFETIHASDRTGPRVAVRVSGIPESGSWQDLKDHFREAGDCVFGEDPNSPNGRGPHLWGVGGMGRILVTINPIS